MEFQYIDIVFNRLGNLVHTNTPGFINQYSTNYIIRVGFTDSTEVKKVSASIKNNIVLPERILFENTSEKILIPLPGSQVTTVISNPYTYQLTQHDTKTFVDELSITVNVVDSTDTIFNGTVNIPMKKSNYSPVILQDDTTLNSLITQLNDLTKKINDHLVTTGHEAMVSIDNTPNTIALRDDYGSTKVSNPVDNLDAANKAYVDGLNNKTVVDSIVSVDEGFLVDYHNGSVTLPFEGSEGIVMDINEADEKIEIHLDNAIYNKLGRALITPLNKPTETEFVTIDTSGSQAMVSITELKDLLSVEKSYSTQGEYIVALTDISYDASFNGNDIYSICEKIKRIEATIDGSVVLDVDVVCRQKAGDRYSVCGTAGIGAEVSCVFEASRPYYATFTLQSDDIQTYNLDKLTLFY